MSLTGPALLERFLELDDFLVEHQDLWRPRPFHWLQLPWEEQHRPLATWLRRRSLGDAEQAHNQPARLDAPAPFPQLARRASQLAALDELPRQERALPPARFASDIPGRKWQQLSAFASHLPFAAGQRHWLDWCSGKGHLGHLLAWPEGRVTCLEHDPQLVDAGARLAQRRQVDACHRRQDVLAADCAILPGQTPVALHACGDLHTSLLRQACAAGCTELAIAPCCYNRIAGSEYQPLSQAAQASSLKLARDDLGLPLSETVTAGARTRRLRDASMARRLAFDLLQRQVRGNDEYLPTPSLPSHWLDRSLRDYCHHLAGLKGLPAPAERDWQALERQGWQRLAEVRNLELLRALFRRPLELWLLLDQALYLGQHGYQVQLGEFCDSRLSPRNLLLLGQQVIHDSCG